MIAFLASCSTTVERRSSAYGGGFGSSSIAKKEAEMPVNQPAYTQENAEKQVVVLEADPVIPTNNTVNETNSDGPTLPSVNNSQASIDIAAIQNELATVITKKSELKKLKKALKKPIAKKQKSSGFETGQTSGWGIASFVLGLLSVFVLPLLLGPLAIVFGALGLNKPMKGLAIAGLVLGIITTLISILALLVFLSLF